MTNRVIAGILLSAFVSTAIAQKASIVDCIKFSDELKAKIDKHERLAEELGRSKFSIDSEQNWLKSLSSSIKEKESILENEWVQGAYRAELTSEVRNDINLYNSTLRSHKKSQESHRSKIKNLESSESSISNLQDKINSQCRGTPFSREDIVKNCQIHTNNEFCRGFNLQDIHADLRTATVNGLQIPRFAIEAFAEALISEDADDDLFSNGRRNKSDVWNDALSKLIDYEVATQEAVKVRIGTAPSRVGINSIDDGKKYIEKQVELINKYFKNYFTSNPITADKVNSYRKSESDKPENIRYKLRFAQFKTEVEANAMLSRLKNGENFQTLLKSLGQTDAGTWADHSSFHPTVFASIKTLSKGGFTKKAIKSPVDDRYFLAELVDVENTAKHSGEGMQETADRMAREMIDRHIESLRLAAKIQFQYQ